MNNLVRNQGNEMKIVAKIPSKLEAVFCKKGFLWFSQNSQENTCARVWNLGQRPQVINFIKKETLAQVLYCEFCKISKNTFSYRAPLWPLLQNLLYIHFLVKIARVN